MAPSLLGLPLEVLLNITSFLDTPSYGNLRLVSSTMEKSTFESFAKEFFSTKQFMITTFSLETLLDISRHPVLKQFLKKVIIGIEQLIARDPEADLESGIADQNNLIAFGSLQRYLTAAFRNLPNCEHVEIRDFESRTKLRDDGIWRSYGAVRWKESGGLVRYHWTREYTFKGVQVPSVIFNQVVNAIAESDMVCTSIGHITKHDPNALQDNAFVLDKFQVESVRRSLANLKLIAFALKSYPASRSSTSKKVMYEQLKAFIRYIPNVTRIRLNGDLIMRMGPINPFDSQVTCIAEWFSVAKISHLELGKLTMSEKTFKMLVDAMSKADSNLHTFVTFRILLDNGSWMSVLDQLAKIPHLRLVMLNCLAEVQRTERGGLRINSIAFRSNVSDPDDAPSKITAMMSIPDDLAKHGSDMRAAITHTQEQIVVQDKAWIKKHRAHGYQTSDSSDSDTSDSSDSDVDSESETGLAPAIVVPP